MWSVISYPDSVYIGLPSILVLCWLWEVSSWGSWLDLLTWRLLWSYQSRLPPCLCWATLLSVDSGSPHCCLTSSSCFSPLSFICHRAINTAPDQDDRFFSTSSSSLQTPFRLPKAHLHLLPPWPILTPVRLGHSSPIHWGLCWPPVCHRNLCILKYLSLCLLTASCRKNIV